MRIICFEVEYVGFKKSWQRIADSGNLVAAINELRKGKTPEEVSLKDAVDKIKAYMRKHKIAVKSSP